MMRFHGRKAASLALGACLGIGGAGAAAAQDGSSQLDELVVTAQKRSESVQDVPLSVTAVSGEALAAAGARSAIQITALAPNLVVTTPYSDSQPQYSLRGISVSDFSQNQQSPIALYVDEVYKGVGALQSLQIYDVDRVEVLRGPQGTLYGKNATGGAISFFTRAPTFEGPNGYLTLGVGNYGARQAAAAYGQEIVEGVLAGRLAATYEKADGFVRQLTPGFADQNGYENWAVRGSLRLRAGETFDAVLRVSANRARTPGYGVIAEGFDERGVGMTGYRRQGLKYLENETDVGGVQRVQGVGASLAMNWDVTPGLRLTSISSYDRGSWLVLEDADGTPFDLITDLYYSKVRSIAQDLRLSTTGNGRLNAVAGLYASRESLVSSTGVQFYYEFPRLGADGQAQCLTDFFTACRLLNDLSQVKVNLSGYVNAEYEITDALSIIGGLRYSRDRLKLRRYTSALSYLDPVTGRDQVDAVPLIAGPLDPSVRDSNVSGRVGLKYRVNPDVLLFANFSTGYRGSSVNGQAFFSPAEITVAKPETLRALEAGLKSEWLDRRLRLNVTAFHYNYRNQQFLDVTPANLSILTNAPKATLYGLEVEATARPTADLTLRAGMGYTHSRYDRLVLRGFDLSGHQIIGTPKVTLNGAAEWTFLRGEAFDLTLRGDAVYTSRRYFDAFQLKDISQSGYWLVNARVSARSKDGAWMASAWVKNLTDQRYAPYRLDLRSVHNFIYAHRGAPRTYGVEVTRNF